MVLLPAGLPAESTDEGLVGVLDLAAVVLDDAEMQLFRRCLDELRAGDTTRSRRMEVNGVVLTVYSEAGGYSEPG